MPNQPSLHKIHPFVPLVLCQRGQHAPHAVFKISCNATDTPWTLYKVMSCFTTAADLTLPEKSQKRYAATHLAGNAMAGGGQNTKCPPYRSVCMAVLSCNKTQLQTNVTSHLRGSCWSHASALPKSPARISSYTSISCAQGQKAQKACHLQVFGMCIYNTTKHIVIACWKCGCATLSARRSERWTGGHLC